MISYKEIRIIIRIIIRISLKQGDPSLALGMTFIFRVLGEEATIRTRKPNTDENAVCESPLLPLSQ